MFSFFQRKIYLVDYLHGFVDIHNHILPGIDDGAKTVEDSIDLIKGFSEFGITNFICTPHILNNLYDNTPESIQDSFKELSKKMVEEGLEQIRIDYAAEHMIDDNFEHILNQDEVLKLGQNHLLIEMSYYQPSINFEPAVDKIKSKQLFPVLAHPERYLFLHKQQGKYNYYKSLGITFQLNMLSLSGYYGPDVKKMALKLVKQKQIDFIASDVHNLSHLASLRDNLTIPKDILPVLNAIIDRTISTFY